MREPCLDPPDYWDDEDGPDCATENGENGNCPLDRTTCRGCRYNRRNL